MPLRITSNFRHEGREHRFVVFYLRDDPLTYRFVIEQIDPATAQPREVFMRVREFEDDAGLGHANPDVDRVIQRELRFLREEYTQQSQSSPAGPGQTA